MLLCHFLEFFMPFYAIYTQIFMLFLCHNSENIPFSCYRVHWPHGMSIGIVSTWAPPHRVGRRGKTFFWGTVLCRKSPSWEQIFYKLQTLAYFWVHLHGILKKKTYKIYYWARFPNIYAFLCQREYSMLKMKFLCQVLKSMLF